MTIEHKAKENLSTEFDELLNGKDARVKSTVEVEKFAPRTQKNSQSHPLNNSNDYCNSLRNRTCCNSCTLKPRCDIRFVNILWALGSAAAPVFKMTSSFFLLTCRLRIVDCRDTSIV